MLHSPCHSHWLQRHRGDGAAAIIGSQMVPVQCHGGAVLLVPLTLLILLLGLLLLLLLLLLVGLLLLLLLLLLLGLLLLLLLLLLLRKTLALTTLNTNINTTIKHRQFLPRLLLLFLRQHSCFLQDLQLFSV